jgi:hypothetical protein
MFDIEISLITANLLLTYYVLVRLKGMKAQVDCMHEATHRLNVMVNSSPTIENSTISDALPPFEEWDKS